MTEEELYALIHRIQSEVDVCGIAYYQWRDIRKTCSAMESRPSTLDRHSYFWMATLSSLQTAYIVGLSKLFDKSKSAFSIDAVLKLSLIHI